MITVTAWCSVCNCRERLFVNGHCDVCGAPRQIVFPVSAEDPDPLHSVHCEADLVGDR